MLDLIGSGRIHGVGVLINCRGLHHTTDTRKTCYVNTKALNVCARENERCAFTETKRVAYGVDQQYRWDIITDGVDCKSSVLSDPAPNVSMVCYVMDFVPVGATPTILSGKTTIQGKKLIAQIGHY